MKHTPTKTPWSYHDGKIYACLPSFMAGRQDRSVTIAKCDSNEVFMTENISMEELHANGRFIVHAVNMHEEMVRLLKLSIPWIMSLDHPANERDKLVADIETALSRAEGKT